MQINTDRVVSLSAMLIGLGSLFIIVYQTALLREQQTASALPYLMMGLQTNSERTYLFTRNTGVGPALIEDVVVRYQGRELRQDPYDFFIDVRPDVASAGLNLGVDRLIPGRLVSAGEWVNMFGADGDTDRVMAGSLLRLFDIGEVPQSWYDDSGIPKSGPDKAIIEVTYRSVYGERWRVSSDSVVPQAL
jgi:hypothetical protein